MFSKRICILAFLMVALAQAANSQRPATVVIATVADASTEQYLSDAEVTIAPIGTTRRTDFVGAVQFSAVRAGVYTITARKIGYQPLSAPIKVSPPDTLRVLLLMLPWSQSLPTVTVTDTAISPFLREFESRRKQGKGYYLTDSVLRSLQGSRLNEVLRMRIPGVRIDELGSVYSTRGVNSIRKETCPVKVIWNGVRIGYKFPFSTLETIGGVEYYPAGRVPVQYQDPGADCGVLLLWPRP